MKDLVEALLLVDLIKQNSELCIVDLDRNEENVVRVLDLSELNRWQMEMDVFQGLQLTINLKFLKKLNLSSNQINQIPDSVFKELIYLIELNLSNNKIEKISTNTLKGLQNLQILNLKSNKIESIDDSSFDHLESLKILILSSNELSTQNDIFGQLNNLIYLDLSENKIKEISSNCYNGLWNLEVLNLEKNQLNRFDNSTFVNKFDSLKVLDIKFNRFDKLTRMDLIGLSKLEYLSLSVNSLDTNCFKYLDNLKVFCLNIQNGDKKSLTRFNKHYFNGLKQLKYLKFSFRGLNLANNSVLNNKLKKIFKNLFDYNSDLQINENKDLEVKNN